ncbi:MAG: PIN domain-containing protein [candidate division KSB1 bacterium]|nr:PIN domain-containing protein [candidate division KSB1 bacterium]
MIFDTDILIWYMRGNLKAQSVLENTDSFNISVITYMELVQGMRNKRELNALRNALYHWDCKTLYVSEAVSTKAMFYIERHYLSHALQIADALIAATAAVNALPLTTGNEKHYKCIKEIELNIFHP